MSFPSGRFYTKVQLPYRTIARLHESTSSSDVASRYNIAPPPLNTESDTELGTVTHIAQQAGTVVVTPAAQVQVVTRRRGRKGQSGKLSEG